VKDRIIIEQAFAQVVQSKFHIEDVNLNNGLRYLNRMMAKFNRDGIELGYLSLSSVDDEIGVPDTVILGMVKNLAYNLWPQYNTDPMNPLIKFSAERSLKSMRAQAINVINPAQFPSTLPVGSGNEIGRYDAQFYTNEVGRSSYLEVENDEQHN
jgi:hypothetical protein